MNVKKELKLAIYESSLDTDDKENLLNIVESTDDEDILCDVVDVLNESYKDKTTKDKLPMGDLDEIKEDLANYKVDLKEIKSLIKKKNYNMANIKIKHAKDRLNRIEKLLKEFPIDVEDRVKTLILHGIHSAATYLAIITMLDVAVGIKVDKDILGYNACGSAVYGGLTSMTIVGTNWKKPIEREIRRQNRILDRLSRKVN